MKIDEIRKPMIKARDQYHRSLGAYVKRIGLSLAVAFTACLYIVYAQGTNARKLSNSSEIHHEIAVDQASQAQVKEYFPSFLEFHDMVMFHPVVGYYSSGRVDFTNDYQTFPIVLAPLFGDMVAEQIFRMWDGMRKSGTLSDTDTFTIGEFGAGDGAMAESILDYIQQQAESNGDPRWAAFAKQAMYVCYDRSPALNEVQRQRNESFGSHFAARIADATDLTATIAKGSLKGVVLSNELPDAFSVHKVILSASGDAEVGYVAPSLPSARWAEIRTYVSGDLARTIDARDQDVRKALFKGTTEKKVYLTKETFTSLLEALIKDDRYESVVTALDFNEIYVPVSLMPELAAHLRRYASAYAGILAKTDKGLVTYVNLGVEKMIHGSADILKAGYVLTIDYGSSWDDILKTDGYPHLRTYGRVHRYISNPFQADEPTTYDPYEAPTLNDMTTDVNFTLLAAEGQLVGLKSLFFGSQKALQSGTSISLDEVPESAILNGMADKFESWAIDFQGPSVYKVMVQQKEGTDDKYVYPDQDPESLGLSRAGLSEAQLKRAAEIEKRLAAQP
jgi:SAM-dependent MidA family methyltransferase